MWITMYSGFSYHDFRIENIYTSNRKHIILVQNEIDVGHKT